MNNLIDKKVKYFKGKYWGDLTEEEHKELLTNAAAISAINKSNTVFEGDNCAIFLNYGLVIEGQLISGNLEPRSYLAIESIADKEKKAFAGQVEAIPWYLGTMEMYNKIIEHDWKLAVKCASLYGFIPDDDNIKYIVKYLTEDFANTIENLIKQQYNLKEIFDKIEYTYLNHWRKLSSWCTTNFAMYYMKIAVAFYDYCLNFKRPELGKLLIRLTRDTLNIFPLELLLKYLETYKHNKGLAFILMQLFRRFGEYSCIPERYLEPYTGSLNIGDKVVELNDIILENDSDWPTGGVHIQPGRIGYICAIESNNCIVDFSTKNPETRKDCSFPISGAGQYVVSTLATNLVPYGICLIKALGADKYHEIIELYDITEYFDAYNINLKDKEEDFINE